MAASPLPSPAIALVGAPDSAAGPKGANQALAPPQAMHLELTHDLVDELLESLKSGKLPQISFGRTPQLKLANKSHLLQTSPESCRTELYKTSPSGSGQELEFAGVIGYRLAVQKAEDVTAGVDSAIEQLRSNMAAISEMREANKTIVGDAGRMPTPTHRRNPSKGFKPAHLAPSSLGSPLVSAPASPMVKPPTSQPAQPAHGHDVLLRALRVPLIHLLAVQPASDSYLAETCRTSVAHVRELLQKVAKQSSSEPDKYQLADKYYRELNPYKFAYRTPQDREQAINNAVKSFDRLRLPKDDKLWQILLPVDERGQGKCLSRLNVKAPEQKAATPLRSIKLGAGDKKSTAKKSDDKTTDREAKRPRETKAKELAGAKPKRTLGEKPPRTLPEGQTTRSTNAAAVRSSPAPAHTSSATPEPASSSLATSARPSAPAHRHTPSTDNMGRIRQQKVMVSKKTGTVTSTRPENRTAKAPPPQRERASRPVKPSRPVSTKPKNPSPLSASPPVNASDFADSHPVHKALAGAPSPAKTASVNSDRSLKRKANDIDSDIHNHYTAVKQPRLDRSTPTHTPSTVNGRGTTATPSSDASLKRKSDDSTSSDTPTGKIRKANNIDTGLANRYANDSHDNQASPDDSSSTTSPVRLSFRQKVELSQKFQQYYKKYEELYWKLAESDTPPTNTQREDLMRMHKMLGEMKRDIKDGVGTGR